jgi:hypothetical protein
MAISPNQFNAFDPNDVTITGISLPTTPYDSYNGINLPYDTNSLSISHVEDFIQGEMVTVQNVVKDFQIAGMMMDPDNFKQEMKIKLALEIAEKLLENKLVEFTKQENLNTNEITFRARAYLVKDDKVRTLRKHSER